MEQKFVFRALIIAFVSLILVIPVFFFYLSSEGRACTQNPLIYGVKQLRQANNGVLISCSCTRGDAPAYKLIFDDANASIVKIYDDTPISAEALKNINLSQYAYKGENSSNSSNSSN